MIDALQSKTTSGFGVRRADMKVRFEIVVEADTLKNAWEELDWKCCQAVHGANEVEDFFIAKVEDEENELTVRELVELAIAYDIKTPLRRIDLAKLTALLRSYKGEIE